MSQLEIDHPSTARTPDGDRECFQFAFDAECLDRLRAPRRPLVDPVPTAPRPGLSSVPLFVADVASDAW